MTPVLATRKRVTKAGRGAHAIYLPKAWIDAWTQEQRARSEVALITLDEHLIVSPIFHGQHGDARLASDDPEFLKRLLLSAYVSGHGAYRIVKEDGFTDTQVVEARRALRLLDERLEVDWTNDTLQFTRSDEDQPLDIVQHLFDLTGTVRETAKNLSELLEYFPHNPERVLHNVHLICAIEREDLQRIKHQAYRNVARLQVPAARVADLALLLLVTHTLARMGKLIVEAACTVSDHMGVPRARLHYPPELLATEIKPPGRLGAAFRSFLDQARRDLDTFREGLADAQALFAPPEPNARLRSTDGRRGTDGIDGASGLELSRRAVADHETVAGSLLRQMQKLWKNGLNDEDPDAIYRVIKLHVHVQDLLEELRTLGDRVTDFRLAETMEGAAR